MRSGARSGALLLMLVGCGRSGFGHLSRDDAPSSGDGAPTDSAMIDGPVIDGLIDGPMIDAPMIDAPMIDAPLLSTAFARWSFDEVFGNMAADSINGATLYLFNGAGWDLGKFNGAGTAEGLNDYFSAGSFNLGATPAVTVSTWVLRDYIADAQTALYEHSPNFTLTTGGFGLFPDNNSVCGAIARILVCVRGDVGQSCNCFAQPTSATWHHLVVVFDKTRTGANETTLYIDGALQVPTSSPSVSDNTNNFSQADFYLFSRGGTSMFSAGLVDETVIFRRALTAAEVAQL